MILLDFQPFFRVLHSASCGPHRRELDARRRRRRSPAPAAGDGVSAGPVDWPGGATRSASRERTLKQATTQVAQDSWTSSCSARSSDCRSTATPCDRRTGPATPNAPTPGGGPRPPLRSSGTSCSSTDAAMTFGCGGGTATAERLSTPSGRWNSQTSAPGLPVSSPGAPSTERARMRLGFASPRPTMPSSSRSHRCRSPCASTSRSSSRSSATRSSASTPTSCSTSSCLRWWNATSNRAQATNIAWLSSAGAILSHVIYSANVDDVSDLVSRHDAEADLFGLRPDQFTICGRPTSRCADRGHRPASGAGVCFSA